ncbi:DUF664 domain-containing protein [Candidatus Bipolaricaulota bacterium]|nr:DUF664 domain-containing protein [Candidatus Bipolaricaulota bacterium]
MAKVADTQLTVFIENIEFSVGKLRRYCEGVSEDEMEWTPTGIRNSLAWIVRHCAGLLWLGYGRISGNRIPANLRGSGIAWGSAKGSTYDETKEEPGVEADECVEYLESAWQTLKGYLVQHDPSWEAKMLVLDRRERNAWTFLWHNLGDFCYHTGQASYLRKLLAAERRRTRSRG